MVHAPPQIASTYLSRCFPQFFLLATRRDRDIGFPRSSMASSISISVRTRDGKTSSYSWWDELTATKTTVARRTKKRVAFMMIRERWRLNRKENDQVYLEKLRHLFIHQKSQVGSSPFFIFSSWPPSCCPAHSWRRLRTSEEERENGKVLIGDDGETHSRDLPQINN